MILIAAEICYNLTKSGYSDWYLPSAEELIEIYINRDIINTTSISNGGSALADERYWSSTEATIPSEYAIVVEFDDEGDTKGIGKSRSYNVRAIRSF